MTFIKESMKKGHALKIIWSIARQSVHLQQQEDVGREPIRFPLFVLSMNPEQLIRTWVETRLQEPEWQTYFLVDITVSGGKKVEVFMDGDTGITLVACRDMSRYLESLLDEGGQLGEDYTLEVSSPGATRPLRFIRQYAKHVGRTLEVKLSNGDKISGALKGVNAEDIMLTETVKVKGKKKEFLERIIPFSDIQESNVKLSFK